MGENWQNIDGMKNNIISATSVSFANFPVERDWGTQLPLLPYEIIYPPIYMTHRSWGELKMQDLKMTDQMSGHENAGPEHEGPNK